MGSLFTLSGKRRLPGAILALIAIAIVVTAMSAGTAPAAGPAYVIGDVFAGVGGGQVQQFSNTGTLKRTLTGAPSQFTTGMAFDAAGNLYSTTFFSNAVSKYDNSGTFVGTFGSGYSVFPESIVRDAAGNFYVGQADGQGDVLKFDSTGLQLKFFDVAREARGSDWIDLAADQCTLFYTSEGYRVMRYDVCTDTQLADFATLPTGQAFALRIRPNGDVMVATSAGATSVVYRLNSTGAVVQSYTLAPAQLFALNLDPDGTSFWTGDLQTGQIFRLDIATGATITQFFSTINPDAALGGLAVFGEITVGTHPTGTITVHKTVDAGAASPTSFCFTLSPDPGNGQVCADSLGAAVFTDVPAGTYSALETASPATYHQVSSTCTGLILVGGGSLSCDVHDTINTGTITVHKTVDTGAASPTSFCFTLSPDPGNGQVCADGAGNAVFSNVPAGTYSALETASPATYHQVSTTCTTLILVRGGSLVCDVHDAFTSTAHDVDAHLSTGGDIRLGNSGTKVTDLKSNCKNEDPAELVRCTIQVSGVPAGCTVNGVGPAGGFLLDSTSFYGIDQTKNFDFKLTTTCSPNLPVGVVATLTFTVCADGGFIDLANPCVDSDLIVDKSPNVVVRTNKLRR